MEDKRHTTAPRLQLLHNWVGHGGLIHAVAVLADGRRAISASYDETFKLWSLDSWNEVGSFHGHSNYLTAAVVLPDGHRAISASFDETLKLWDLNSGVVLRTFRGHTDGVHAVAVLPDGYRAISASADRTLKLWDLASGVELHSYRGHTGGVWAVAVLPDGRRAISGAQDKTLILWDLFSRAVLARFKSNAPLGGCAVAPDGRTIVAGDDNGELYLLRLEEGRNSPDPDIHERSQANSGNDQLLDGGRELVPVLTDSPSAGGLADSALPASSQIEPSTDRSVHPSARRGPVDFVIITALEEERDALLGKLPDAILLSPSRKDIRRYYSAEIDSNLLNKPNHI